MKVWHFGLATTVLGAALAATLLAQAAPGDVLVVAETPPIYLTPPQKTLAAAALLEVFPTANAATVTQYGCRRVKGGVQCFGEYERLLTRDQFIVEAVAGLSGSVVEYSGGNVTFHQRTEPTIAPTTTDIAAFASSMCGRPIAKIRRYLCDRGGAEIICKCTYADTVNPDTFVTLAQAGLILKTIDIVE